MKKSPAVDREEIDGIADELGLEPIGPHRAVTEVDIKAFEEELDGKLPAEYRYFLTHYGHTAPEVKNPFPLANPGVLGKEATLKNFFGFSDKKAASKTLDIHHATFEVYPGRIPDDMIPIGATVNGAIILLGFSEDVTNQVWLWDPDATRLPAENLKKAFADLETEGHEISEIDPHAALYYWERLHPEELEKPAGHSNLHFVTDNFVEFLCMLLPPESFAD